MAKILFIGDVFGRPGRRALRSVLPLWQAEHQPDATVVNVENLAHGKGVTPHTLREMASLDIDCFTSGNHVFDKGDLSAACFREFNQLIRPVNFSASWPGFGYYRFAKAGRQFLIINANGRVFFERQFSGDIDNPFSSIDRLLLEQSQKNDIILVDFHSEATSEKQAMGWFLDGRVTAVIGTHTHVPTADERILPQATGYLSDAGMTGPADSVIGVKVQSSLDMFLEKNKFVMDIEEEGPAVARGVLVEADQFGRATGIKRLSAEV